MESHLRIGHSNNYVKYFFLSSLMPRNMCIIHQVLLSIKPSYPNFWCSLSPKRKQRNTISLMELFALVIFVFNIAIFGSLVKKP